MAPVWAKQKNKKYVAEDANAASKRMPVHGVDVGLVEAHQAEGAVSVAAEQGCPEHVMVDQVLRRAEQLVSEPSPRIPFIFGMTTDRTRASGVSSRWTAFTEPWSWPANSSRDS